MRHAGLILCGGRSRRMGTDKGALPFGDETILDRVVRVVSSVVDEIWLVAREGQTLELGASSGSVEIAGTARRAWDPWRGSPPDCARCARSARS